MGGMHRLEVSEEDRELSFERLRNVFHLPISKAAKQLNVGVTVMKKYCRWYCVDRWPYRKIHSVDKLIAVLKELQATSTTNEVSKLTFMSFMTGTLHCLVLLPALQANSTRPCTTLWK